MKRRGTPEICIVAGPRRPEPDSVPRANDDGVGQASFEYSAGSVVTMACPDE